MVCQPAMQACMLWILCDHSLHSQPSLGSWGECYMLSCGLYQEWKSQKPGCNTKEPCPAKKLCVAGWCYLEAIRPGHWPSLCFLESTNSARTVSPFHRAFAIEVHQSSTCAYADACMTACQHTAANAQGRPGSAPCSLEYALRMS